MSYMTKVKRAYLNSREACQYLGIKNVNTLYTYIASGKLKAHKLGINGNRKSRRHWRFVKEELDEFVIGKNHD